MLRRLAHHAALPLVGMVAFLCVTTMVGCTDRTAPPSNAPRATIESVEGASTTYHTRDWNGKPVTVRATVTTVDTATHRVKVRTSEGQTIVLSMAPGSLAGLKTGDLFLFTVPEASRP